MSGLLDKLAELAPNLMHNAALAAGAAMRTVTNGNMIARDGVYKVPAHMDSAVAFSITRGRYEGSDIELLRRHFKPEPHVIIDAGANAGIVARHALKKLDDNGLYVCVEPNPQARHALETNMRRGLRGNQQYRIVAAAITDPSREGRFEELLIGSKLDSRLAGGMKAAANENTARVTLRSLSGIMKDVAPKGASLICDIEGGEIPMVLKDPGAFSPVRQILIELHQPELTGSTVTPKDMLGHFQRLGFRPVDQIGNSHYLTRDL